MSAHLAAVAAERDRLKAELHQERIARAFDRSPFVRDRLGIPAEIAAARFAPHFRIEGSRIVGEIGGAAITDPTTGDVADFDTAIAAVVASYPNRDAILRPAGGAGGSGNGGQNSRASMSRAAFDALPEEDRRAHIKSGGTLHDEPRAETRRTGQTPHGALMRAAFDALPPAERMAHIKAGGRIHD